MSLGKRWKWCSIGLPKGSEKTGEENSDPGVDKDLFGRYTTSCARLGRAGADSSAEERLPYKQVVVGSIPSPPTSYLSSAITFEVEP